MIDFNQKDTFCLHVIVICIGIDMLFWRFCCCALYLLWLCGGDISWSRAIQPRLFGSEGRFKVWTYYPNSVYSYTGYYTYPTYIEFENGEKITSIASPKTNAWILWPVDNRLFLKPVQDAADTTATVMTNKRTYFFELRAKEAKGPFDTDVAFFIKFDYPKASGNGGDSSFLEFSTNDVPDLTHPELYNFNYTVSGDEEIKPIMAFDDGQFTYLKFRSRHTVMPAVFSVDQQGYEGIVNYRTVGDYMVIESLSRVFTLRNGPATVCVFSENMMQKSEMIESMKPGFLARLLKKMS